MQSNRNQEVGADPKFKEPTLTINLMTGLKLLLHCQIKNAATSDNRSE
jgi:hypothetical protein